jgi:glycosyltransferase involved in cell wall biosynthesis
MDLFSIVMPAFNSGRTIIASIESVLAQTHRNFELIIINDCSNDATTDILNSYYFDNRIKVIHNDINMGVAASRNKGIISAKGDYICFLDSDDIWYANKLERQLLFFKKGYRVICSNYDVIDEDSRLIGQRNCPEIITYKDMLRSNFIGNLTGCYSTSYFGKVFQEKIGHEDYVMWLQLLQQCESAYCIQDRLAAYRLSKKSVSSNKLKVIKWQWYIYRRVLGIDFLLSSYYFVNYIFHAIKKRS